MLETILNKVYKPSTIAGIVVKPNGENGVLYDLLMLKSTKGIVRIEHQEQNIDIDKLSDRLNNTPAIICFTGNEVIIKRYEGEIDDRNAFLAKILPGANTNDLYFNKIETSVESNLISIIRLSVIEENINKLKEKGIGTIGLSVGCKSIEMLLDNDLLTTDESQIDTNTYSLNINSTRSITAVKSNSNTNRTYNIAGIEVDGAMLVPFAAVMEHLVGLVDDGHLPLSVFENKYETLSRTVSKKLLKSSLVGFLLVLLINFIVYGYYFSANRELEAETFSYRSKFTAYEQLKERHSKIYELFEGNNWMGASRSSFYADQIAQIVPGTTTLTELVIFPEIEHKPSEKPTITEYRSSYIDVKGQTDDNIVFDSFVKALRTKTWVMQVTVNDYYSLPEGGLSAFDLTIETGKQ